MSIQTRLALLALVAGCSSPGPDDVTISVAPNVISSTEGTLHVDGLVITDRVPDANQPVHIEVAYTDRNGATHQIAPVDIKTDHRGAYEGILTGLTWQGEGTVTATVEGTMLAATATFSVLDQTPPTVTILPPTTNLHVGPGLPIDVEVHVTDEIGVSSVTFEAAGEAVTSQTTVVASGTTDATVTFQLDVPDVALPGPTITLYAVANDLSGNIAAAKPVVLTVDPVITVATPTDLTGTLLTDGTNQLNDPRSIALSPKDGMLYVSDVGGGGGCGNTCIKRVDPTSGVISGTIVYTGVNRIEGIAFDATGDHLYFSDRNDRLGQLTYSTATSKYDAATVIYCNNINNNLPQDPYHLAVDPTLGVLVADQNDQRLYREAGCTQQDPTNASAVMDTPWGVALGPAGQIYVSDEALDLIVEVSRTTGALTLFEDHSLDGPRGLEWITGTTSRFANSLLVANHNARRLSSTKGPYTIRTAAYFRNEPVDVAVSGTNAYVLVAPGGGGLFGSFGSGRIYKIAGF